MDGYDLYDDWDDFDGEDLWDLEDDFDGEADEYSWRDIIGPAVNTAAKGVYDYATRKVSDKNKWKKWGRWAVGAGSGALASAISTALSEDADPFEPEYTADEIDMMEALAEEAIEADGEDSVIAADEMVSRSFGLMKAAARMRPVIAAIAGRVRKMVAMAKKDPRYRTVARIAPLALRRTASTLMKMAASGRPVTVRTAMMIFGRTLAALSRSPGRRAQAVRQAQMRARRHRQRKGAPAPVRARRPVSARSARAAAARRAAHAAMRRRRRY